MALRISPTITGGLSCPVPGTSMLLLWIGPGSGRLYLITAKAQMIQVEPDRFIHDGTARGARAAMRLFVEEGQREAA